MGTGGENAEMDNMYVPPRFSALKEEALNSGVIGVKDWTQDVIGKAQKLLNESDEIRSWRAKSVHFPSAVEVGSAVTEQHLCAIILWTDFPQFATAFNKTFRKSNPNDTVSSVKRRNSYFHFMAKNLKEAVQHFGTCDAEQEDDEKQNPTFYCGLDREFLFTSSCFVMNGPLSTTQSSGVATSFAGENGIMVTVKVDGTHYSSRLRYLSVRHIALYDEDNEYLFFGGPYPLRVANVWKAGTRNDYKKLYYVLFGFDCLIDGWRPKGKRKKRFSSGVQYLQRLINHQIGAHSRSGVASKSMDEYTMNTFTAYCAFRETVTVNMWCLDKFIHLSLRQLILSEIQENVSVSDLSEDATVNVPNLKVFQIFENLKTLNIHSTSRRGTVFYPMNVEHLISELNVQKAVLSVDFTALIIKARVWTQSVGDQQSDEYSSDDDEPLQMNTKQSRFGGTGFRSWIDELWQISGDSLKEMVNQRLSGWDIAYANLGNEDHLVIRRVTEERKEDDVVIMSIGAPKPYPGDHWKDQYPDQVDPRGEPAIIEFRWNKKIKEITDCDTQHMVYLLQGACELYRLRVIQRNKHFQSISRADRYIDHLDTPQIISNFLQWHDDDKEHNLFTGQMLRTREAPSMIDLIRNVCCIKRGPATVIYDKLLDDVKIKYLEVLNEVWITYGMLKNKVVIKYDKDCDNRFVVKTWGFYKMYTEEKVLEDCTVEDVVTLFSFVNEEEKFDGDVVPEHTVNGVFAYIEANPKGSGSMRRLVAIDGWKETVIEWIREEQLDGNKLKFARNIVLSDTLRVKLEPNDPKKARRLRIACNKMYDFAKELPVHKVLMAAKAQTESVSDE